jgi:SAM-dependent methyltransferase
MIQEALWMLRYVERSLRTGIRSWRRDLAAWRRFWDSYKRYEQLARPDREALLEHLYPCLGDDTEETPIDPIYFYQDAWAFERIVKQRPAFHVDVGSHHKLVALLSTLVPVIMVDIRPLSLPLDGLRFRKGSILSLPFDDATVPSVSSLCVVEHVGLGRYGDALDPRGSEKAIEELKRVLQPSGHLYVSLPIDDENRVCFNAHRVFDEEYALELFAPLQLVERRYVYDRSFGDRHRPGFGTGCYHLKCPR